MNTIKALLAVCLLTLGITLPASAQPTWGWAKQEGTAYYYDWATRMAISSNNQLVTFANIGLAPGMNFSSGQEPALTAFDSTGAVQWRSAFNGSNTSCQAVDFKAIPGGGFYGLINFGGTINLGPLGLFPSSALSSPYGFDGLLIRYDAVGQVIWARQIMGTSNISGGDHNILMRALAIDAAGDVWVAGMYSISLSIGPYTFGTTISGGRGFVARYSPNGNVRDVLPFGGTNNSYATALVADPQGGMYMTGTHYSSPTSRVLIGSYVLPLATTRNFFIAHINAQLQPDWVRPHISADSVTSDFITLTSDGGYMVAGHLAGTAQFGSYTLTIGGRRNRDIFVVRYDSLGQVRWAQRAASSGRDLLYAFTADASDNSYLSSYTFAPFGAMTIGSQTVTPPTGSGVNALFARLSPQGQTDWTMQTTEVGDEYGMCMIPDANHGVYCTGFFTNTVTLGPTAMTAVGGGDYFIARLNGARPTGLWEGASLDGSGLTLWPNPTGSASRVTLRLPGVLTEAATLTLTDALGRVVQRSTMVGGTQSQELDVLGLPTGVYLATVTTATSRVTKRLVVAP